MPKMPICHCKELRALLRDEKKEALSRPSDKIKGVLLRLKEKELRRCRKANYRRSKALKPQNIAAKAFQSSDSAFTDAKQSEKSTGLFESCAELCSDAGRKASEFFSLN